MILMISWWSDRNSHFRFCAGNICQMLYAPKFGDPFSFQMVFGAMTNISDTNIVIWYGFNYTLDPLLDKQSLKSLQRSNPSVQIRFLIVVT